jgi:hypothetical protein
VPVDDVVKEVVCRTCTYHCGNCRLASFHRGRFFPLPHPIHGTNFHKDVGQTPPVTPTTDTLNNGLALFQQAGKDDVGIEGSYAKAQRRCRADPAGGVKDRAR